MDRLQWNGRAQKSRISPHEFDPLIYVVQKSGANVRLGRRPLPKETAGSRPSLESSLDQIAPTSAIRRCANRSRKQTFHGAQFKVFTPKRLCENKARCALPPRPVCGARVEGRAI